MVVKPLCLTFLALAFKALLNAKEEEVRWLNAEVPKMQDTAYTHMPHMGIATLTQIYLH